MSKTAPQDAGKTRRGRWAGAWAVLRGQEVTPVQMRAEWLEYQLAFDGIFDKLNTSLARIAKREQRSAARMMEVITDGTSEESTPAGTAAEGRKADIRRRVAQIQSIGR